MVWNLNSIKSVFLKMEQDNWNLLVPKKWGFFFRSVDKNKLLAVYKELEVFDYQFEKLEFWQDINSWQLMVSKQEVLIAEKLHRRNIAFKELAEAWGIKYDGWDVEKIA